MENSNHPQKIHPDSCSQTMPIWNGASTGTWKINYWSIPTLIETRVFSDHIELVYKQHSLIGFSGIGINDEIQQRVFKQIHSCVEGLWHVSEPIYGKIISPQGETYDFD